MFRSSLSSALSSALSQSLASGQTLPLLGHGSLALYRAWEEMAHQADQAEQQLGWAEEDLEAAKTSLEEAYQAVEQAWARLVELAGEEEEAACQWVAAWERQQSTPLWGLTREQEALTLNYVYARPWIGSCKGALQDAEARRWRWHHEAHGGRWAADMLWAAWEEAEALEALDRASVGGGGSRRRRAA